MPAEEFGDFSPAWIYATGDPIVVIDQSGGRILSTIFEKFKAFPQLQLPTKRMTDVQQTHVAPALPIQKSVPPCPLSQSPQLHNRYIAVAFMNN